MEATAQLRETVHVQLVTKEDIARAESVRKNASMEESASRRTNASAPRVIMDYVVNFRNVLSHACMTANAKESTNVDVNRV